ncbi:hypothetical protein IFR05_016147 [Cadophora sp. M221]|nr:hypothetical protein IFR05_016147 [Cadophora sp. M221]
MDMGSTTMSMAATATSMTMDMGAAVTSAAASASTTAAMDMDMDMGMGDCKISMLWNWNTVDSCFIAKSWHITSNGVFVGCCIGVILLVMSLEFLRRLGKEYDRFILRQHTRQQASILSTNPIANSETGTGGTSPATAGKDVAVACTPQSQSNRGAMAPFRPNIFQQMIRATLHMVSFTVAYFVMLLVMYYNGYIIICIIIGAWLGSFVFSWESVDVGGPKEEVTVCCG